MSNAEIAEFQRSRSSWLRRAMPFMVLFFMGAVIAVSTTRYEIGAYLGLVSFVGWSYFTWRLYRCPRCNKIPGADDGVALNPKFCRNCGAQLRANV